MLVQHLYQAARLLARTPGFTAAAVICLALGIAVNTTMFSLFDALVLHPFAYPEPDRLVSVRGVFQRIEPEGLSGPEVAAVGSAPSVVSAAAFDFGNRNLTGIETPERLFTAIVGAGTFSTYRMSPMLGRAFTEQEHRADTGVVIIGHRLWQRRFGSDSGIVGRLSASMGHRALSSAYSRHDSCSVCQEPMLNCTFRFWGIQPRCREDPGGTRW